MKLSEKSRGILRKAVLQIYVYRVSADEAEQRGRQGDWSFAMYLGAAAAVAALAVAIGLAN